MAGNAWKTEEDQLILQLIAEGHSASVIGEKIGRTRNSVIGRAHRLKLNGVEYIRGETVVKKSKPKPPTPPKKKKKPPLDAKDLLVGALLELRNDQCRWPLSDHFCSNTKLGTEAYCAEHKALAYQPLRGRQ